jgi:3-hydroxybutyryl-CoA dehydratase
MNEGKTLHDLAIGETARVTKTLTQADVTLFAGITGDFNPLHMDHAYAATTRFGQPVVHGALLAGLVSAVLGMHLPGPGALYASQRLDFKRPVFIGDTITAEAEIVEKVEEKNRVRFITRCINQDGDLVAEGESVLLPKKPAA